jgi:sporulation integral membrane protein YtvI
LIYVFIGGAITLIIAGLVVAVREALPLLPRYYETAIEPALNSARNAFADFQEALPGLFRLPADTFSLAPTLQSLLSNISRAGLDALSGFTGKVPSFLITVLFTVMLSFFISIHYEEASAFLAKNAPENVSRVFRDARVHLFDAVLKYLGAMLTMMAVTFCELLAGLTLLRLQNAVIVAAGIALLDALPVIGSGTALVPWAIVELLRGNIFFGVGLVLLWGVILFVKSTLEPKLVGDRLGLNPVVALTAIFVGYKLFGFAGMILMPITAHILITLYKNGSFGHRGE